jgi:hypothetical protein
MLHGLVSTTRQLFDDFQRSWFRSKPTPLPNRETQAPIAVNYAPLQRVLITDEVGRTLFEEYAAHRGAERGAEETGWVLLGLRQAREAIVLGTLPAGSDSDAGVAHILFNSNGQALASQIVRQRDRRLTILGVVHTHPGSLRHPSDGDFRGDREWVRNLRGKEGVFGIGTADGPANNGSVFAYQPKSHVKCMGPLRFSWYALGEDDANYRALPVELTIGPDLARPLHAIWSIVEEHAERLERLYKQQARVRFDVLSDVYHPGLLLTVPLAETGKALRVVIRRKDVRYYLERGSELLEVGSADECVDRGVYRLLAELASDA